MVEKRVVRTGYDELAEAYAADRSEDGREVAILREFLDSVPAPERLLEAGCGGGTPILRELDAVAPAVGIDFSRAQLRLADRAVPEADPVQGDMTSLPFAAGVFDAVTAYHSLIHLPLADRAAVFGEFARVLAPGGRLLASEGPQEWQGTNPDWLDSGVEMQWTIAGAAATRDHLREAGFAIETEWEVREDEHWMFFAARLD